MQRREKIVTAAVITTAGTIIVAMITTFGPTWWRPAQKSSDHFVIAGTVVDNGSNQAVPQAAISVSGRTETYITEDNGNFRFEIRGLSPGERVRIHVTKDGYRPFDEAVTPSAENLVIPLRKM